MIPIGRPLIAIASLVLGGPGGVSAQVSSGERPVIGPVPLAPAAVFMPQPPSIGVTAYATGLEIVWSLEFAPDGRLFVAERPGRVRVVSAGGVLEATPWLTLRDVDASAEGGLLGLALHPSFPREPWLYVFYTLRQGERSVNRVSRWREVDGRGAEEQVLLDDLRAGTIHNGGRLRFGPDEMLYIALGDVFERELAQDLSVPNGSILRLAPDGAVPPDNPWPGNPIWAYGVRNVNGLAFRPGDGALFAADHGPTTEWRGPPVRDHDEISIIRKGGNYGWPRVVGAPGAAGMIDPLLAWVPGAPPGDLIFYDAALMPELRGDLFFSTLRAESLFRIRFQDPAAPDRVTAIERWFHAGSGPSVHGRLRGMAVGPDGALYVGTGNHDMRSPLRPGDDQVLRIAPLR